MTLYCQTVSELKSCILTGLQGINVSFPHFLTCLNSFDSRKKREENIKTNIKTESIHSFSL